MRKGERITLIKRIASTLSEEPWPDVRLTLAEFGVSYDDEFGGGLYEMVLHAAQGSPDEVLIELNSHLHPDARSIVESSAGGSWDPDAFRLFVSHTHAHRKLASEPPRVPYRL